MTARELIEELSKLDDKEAEVQIPSDNGYHVRVESCTLHPRRPGQPPVVRLWSSL